MLLLEVIRLNKDRKQQQKKIDEIREEMISPDAIIDDKYYNRLEKNLKAQIRVVHAQMDLIGKKIFYLASIINIINHITRFGANYNSISMVLSFIAFQIYMILYIICKHDIEKYELELVKACINGC